MLLNMKGPNMKPSVLTRCTMAIYVATLLLLLTSPPSSALDAIEPPTRPQAKSSQEILNDIVNYGLDRTRYLVDILERKIYDEGQSLSKSDPAHFVAVFNKQTQKAKELSKYGYATLEASSLLTKQFMLTRQQVVYGLERVELRSTDLFIECPFRLALERNGWQEGPEGRQRPGGEPRCKGLDLLYRTADGTCNNLKHTSWGSSFMPFLRFLPPDYSDGVQAFRKARSGGQLPSPRLISSSIHRQSQADTQQFTMLVMQWGQFIDHDITSTPQSRGFNNSFIKCCSKNGQLKENALLHPDCKPISIPSSDLFYSQFNATCMEFVRSSPAPRRDCTLGPRDQINQITSFIDASNVYGSTPEDHRALRLGKRGKLKYTDLHIRKPLLPALDPKTAHEECRIPTRNLHCFAAGDFRCNEQPGLTSMHTIFLREHNRIAIELSDINPHWKDERTFHEARKIVGAMLQHITFNEWLPIVLGPRVLEIFELKLLPKGYYTLYNDTVNPTVSNAFGSAAFRFGHSLVKNSLSRCNKDFREVPFFIKLHKELNNPSNLHNFGSVDRILLGLATKMLGRRDEFISEELTNHLFQTPKLPYGMDLASLNIQRGRDHGLPAYNIWREQCGLRRFSRFSEMTDVINVETVDRMQKIYDHIDDIDLFTGGLAERPVTGGVVGPTFACIIGQQFLNLRKGDRFWYENGNHPGSFSSSQLQELRKASLTRVICDGLDDIESLQPFAFLTVDGFNNKRKACRGTGIPRVNLRVWAESQSGPQQLSVASSVLNREGSLVLPDFGNDLSSNSATSGPNQEDLDFQQYLNDKSNAEELAFSPKPETDSDEIPKPLSRENYLHVFDNEPDPLLLFNDASLKARSGFESETNRKLEELFKSAREEAFEDENLFY